jgi:acyl carrier protein
MSVPWDENFDATLRASMPRLPEGAPLEPGTSLAAHGMDSMASIDLLLRLEESYQVAFPDEALTSQTFATPGSLWSVLSGLRTDPAGAGR